jgi:ribosomal protein S18 acetylase RimI-like enzyme
MERSITYRKAKPVDIVKLSVLFSQVYIHTYGTEGVSDEFANFIARQFSAERLGRLIADDPDALIVAVYNNNLVGVAEVDFEKECPVNHIVSPELSKLYVLEWFCGQGIGYHLLKEAEHVVKARGQHEMWLWVLVSNERAISFYERQNYQWIGNAVFQMEQNCYDNKIMLKRF